jgi:transposase-like protein
MKTRRVGKSLIEVASSFGTEAQCLDFLEQARWSEGVRCVKCDSDRISKFNTKETTRKRRNRAGEEIVATVPSRRLYDCMECGFQFSTTTGTLFHDTHLPLTKWFQAIAIMCNAKKGKSALELQRDLQIAYRTAWFLAHRIRKAMEQGLGMFGGTVEVDCTFVGGKFDKRRKRERLDKPAVAGIIQRNIDEGHSVVKAFRVPGETRPAMFPLIDKHVSKDATIYTDERSTYKNLKKTRNHEIVIHSTGEYVRGDVSTNAVENFWSLLKRGIAGSYHRISVKHLQSYVNEFAFRFNNRENQDLFTLTVLNLVIASALQYKALTASSQAAQPDSSEDVPF